MTVQANITEAATDAAAVSAVLVDCMILLVFGAIALFLFFFWLPSREFVLVAIFKDATGGRGGVGGLNPGKNLIRDS